MKLYLMRHGEALHPAVDPEMRLSPRGRQETLTMGEFFKREGVVIDAVWHSPKARALETAQAMAETLGLNPAVLQLQRELVPEGDAASTHDRINRAEKDSQFQGLLIVSHLPFLPQLTGLLTGQSSQTDFDTASAACFIFSEGVWTREWLKEPRRIQKQF